jgi:response regulator RpfG family c-di-GMP phosphodiesterase
MAFTHSLEALENFQSNPNNYWLVLSDIRMPGLSGIVLAKKVKEINPAIKVVLMTTIEVNNNEFTKVFPSTKVDGFVHKPINIREVVGIIGSQWAGFIRKGMKNEKSCH